MTNVSTIESLGLSIVLPEGMIQQGNPNLPQFCFQDSLGTRYPKCFTIAEVKTEPEEDFLRWDTVEMNSGGKLYYQKRSVNVGSGGMEEHLIGYAKIGERYFQVRANDQQKSGHPDSTWCIPIVQTLHSTSDKP